MIRAAAALLLTLCAAVAQAQELPALFDVRGVAADDRLNIRTGPDASAPRIGAFAPDRTGIEVTARSADGRWGRVNTDERSGWTALRFLTAQPATDTPAVAACFGTEPFWTLRRDGATWRWITPAQDTGGIALDPPITAQGRTDSFALTGTDGDKPVTAVIRRASCGDGMSDRAYGLHVALLRGPTLYSGCCTLAD